MTITLTLPPSISQRLRELANDDLESGAVLLARLIRSPEGNIHLLARSLEEVPADCYERRERSQLLIASSGYVPALRIAAETGCVPIWFHTHPGTGAIPRPSKHDDIVNAELSDLFRLRADSEFYGCLVLSPDDKFTGFLDDGDAQYSIDRLVTVGERFTVATSFDASTPPLPELLDRNIRAFGGDVQRVLRDLRVAVIGCGGTGSAVAEQLVRLGVTHLTLMDPDELSESNVSRVYGSRLKDAGRAKVDVLAQHLNSILPDLHIRSFQAAVTQESAARELIAVDVVFGCTDDNAGRMVLSRLSSYLLIPVIDCGVLLTADQDGRLDGIHGRVTVMHPGAACLICRGRVDMARAMSEGLSEAERQARVREGYAPALGQIEPAVVTFTTMVAATAVGELVERLTGYGVDPNPNELLLRLHDRELSTNRQAPRPKHFCSEDSGKWGIGETTPFLEQVWRD